jgi:hypothetical protein
VGAFEEGAWVRASAAYRQNELDFCEQSHKPWTWRSLLRTALWARPRGSLRNSKAWSDSADGIEHALTKDQLLTNVMSYQEMPIFFFPPGDSSSKTST